MNDGIIVLIIGFILINIIRRVAGSLSSGDKKEEKKKNGEDFFGEMEKRLGQLDFAGEDEEPPYQPYSTSRGKSAPPQRSSREYAGETGGWDEDRFESKGSTEGIAGETSGRSNIDPRREETGWSEDRFEESRGISGDERKRLEKAEEMVSGSPISRMEITGQRDEIISLSQRREMASAEKRRYMESFLKNRSNLQNAILLSAILGPCRAKKTYNTASTPSHRDIP